MWPGSSRQINPHFLVKVVFRIAGGAEERREEASWVLRGSVKRVWRESCLVVESYAVIPPGRARSDPFAGAFLGRRRSWRRGPTCVPQAGAASGERREPEVIKGPRSTPGSVTPNLFI